jgi:spoIIIJ-associated protein
VQWVVTTGRTVEEARERALDALGIDESELELEVLDEPRSGLFGLRRTDARIRARVRPTRPRPKVDRRNRRKSASSGSGRRRSKRTADTDAADRSREVDAGTGAEAAEPAAGGASGRGRRRGRRRGEERPATGAEAASGAAGSSDGPEARASGEAAAETVPASGGRRSRSDRDEAPAPAPSAPQPPSDTDETPPGATGDSMSDISLDEQEPSAVGFVQGLVDAFGVDATVEARAADDEHLEISVSGEDLGLLVGPRGATLNAIQELTRTAVAQQHSGRLEGRLRVDVAGYRARRKEALERFVLQQAERVKETGTPVALEPMSPPDRKIVHDAVNDIDGVRTTSEGEDRRRHVVILPE